MNLSSQLGDAQLGDLQLGNIAEGGTAATTQTIIGVARIQATITRTIDGLARIQGTQLQTITGTYLIATPVVACTPLTVNKVVPWSMEYEPCERKGT